MTTVLRFECRICGKDTAITWYVRPHKTTDRTICSGCWSVSPGRCPARERRKRLSDLVKRLKSAVGDERDYLYKRAVYLRRVIKVS